MNSRTSTPDLLKGIAALLMIQVHIIELFATPEIFSSNIGKVLLFLGGPPVAPLYIFFLGYFIAGSRKSTLALVVRGVKILLLGLFLNIALNLNLIISVGQGLFPINLWPYIFGVDVLPHAGLSIILIALLKKIIDKNIFVPIVLLLLVAFSGTLFLDCIPEKSSLKYLSALIYGSSWWSYFPLLPWFAYSLAGIAFYQFSKKYDLSFLKSPKAFVVMLLIGIPFLFFTLSYAIAIASNLELYYHHGIVFCLWTLAFMALYAFVINKIDTSVSSNIVMNYLKWLGENITIIYVFQWIIIGNVATQIFKTVSSPTTLCLSFLGVLCASSILCFIWLKFKSNFVQQ